MKANLAIRQVLTLIYSIGVNDGLREALGRSEREGARAAVDLALAHLEKLGVEFTDAG